MNKKNIYKCKNQSKIGSLVPPATAPSPGNGARKACWRRKRTPRSTASARIIVALPLEYSPKVYQSVETRSQTLD